MESLFISYARKDDERFARRLHRDLSDCGFYVWWDRKAMESRGRTFLQEIRDAISSVERVILVVGPKAAKSKYVQAEWGWALENCKVVVPVLRLGDDSAVPRPVSDQDYRLIARELANFHAIDFRHPRSYREALQELVRILRPLPSLAE